MTRDEVLKAIRMHRGDILVGVLLRSDIMYVKAVKSDLLKAVENIADNEASTSCINGCLYIDNAH